MRPATVLGACLALTGLAACTSSGPTAAGDVRLFPGTDLTAAFGTVLDAVASMDGRVVTASVDEGAGAGRLLVLHEWRRPESESAVLHVVLRREGEGVRIHVTAEPLGKVLERASRPGPAASGDILPPAACRPCQDQLGRKDLTGRGNARVLANLRRARRAFFAAWDGGAPEPTGPAAAPEDPGR